MIRDRLLRRRWLVWLVVAWGLALASPPHPGEAGPLPPARGDDATGRLGFARTELERRLVQSRLAALGVSGSEAAQVWARLTPDERAELVARADELRAGGNVAAAVVAIGIIVAMFVILALELIGRRVISRPSEPEGAKP
jgi:uncharacterized protein DUF6627